MEIKKNIKVSSSIFLDVVLAESIKKIERVGVRSVVKRINLSLRRLMNGTAKWLWGGLPSEIWSMTMLPLQLLLWYLFSETLFVERIVMSR